MPAARAPEVEAFCAFLKAASLKQTAQRLDIAECVFSIHRHFTAEELFRQVRKRSPAVGRVTVYRTLEHLVASGMVEELSMRKGVATYEHTAGHAHHDHLICTLCGKVKELSSRHLEDVKAGEARALGWLPQHHALKVYGLCPECKARQTAQS